jgi:outer membrane immunogenic protein
MKKFLVAGIAAAAFCGAPAFATDMPVRAPVYKAAAPYDPWTGFYVGGSIGARWSNVDWRTINIGGAPASSNDNPAHLDKTTIRVGGYVGYNWKVAPSWLVGLEADIAWGDSSKTHTPFPGIGPPLFGAGHDFVTAKLGWDGSIRGRVGFLVNPNWLVYATGGAAWQQIKTSATCDNTGLSFCGIVVNESNSTTKAGWTVGGGIEAMLSSNWFGRIEYRYADFGHVTNTLPPAPGTGFNANVNVKTNTALLGLAYKF